MWISHRRQDRLSPICGISWSPNQQRLAIATIDRTIQLYDENGEKRDKFSTKPVDAANGKESYVVRDIAFSPDSTRLAVAQSDNIVYVYKFGSNWNDKKVICNKFPQSSSVVKMIWLSVGPIIAGKFMFYFYSHLLTLNKYDISCRWKNTKRSWRWKSACVEHKNK